MKFPIYGTSDVVSRIAFNENTNYYRELAKHIYLKSFFQPVSFLLKNVGENLAPNIRVRFLGKNRETLRIIDKTSYPQPPKKSRNLNLKIPVPLGKYKIRNFDDVWEFRGNFGSIQPKDEILLDESIYLGCTEETILELEAEVFADNLSKPVKVPLSIEIDIEERLLNFKELGIK